MSEGNVSSARAIHNLANSHDDTPTHNSTGWFRQQRQQHPRQRHKIKPKMEPPSTSPTPAEAEAPQAPPAPAPAPAPDSESESSESEDEGDLLEELWPRETKPLLTYQVRPAGSSAS